MKTHFFNFMNRTIFFSSPRISKRLLGLAVVSAIVLPVHAHDMSLAAANESNIVDQWGHPYCVRREPSRRSLLFENGVITEIAAKIEAPSGAK